MDKFGEVGMILFKRTIIVLSILIAILSLALLWMYVQYQPEVSIVTIPAQKLESVVIS